MINQSLIETIMADIETAEESASSMLGVVLVRRLAEERDGYRACALEALCREERRSSSCGEGCSLRSEESGYCEKVSEKVDACVGDSGADELARFHEIVSKRKKKKRAGGR